MSKGKENRRCQLIKFAVLNDEKVNIIYIEKIKYQDLAIEFQELWKVRVKNLS